MGPGTVLSSTFFPFTFCLGIQPEKNRLSFRPGVNYRQKFVIIYSFQQTKKGVGTTAVDSRKSGVRILFILKPDY